VNGTCAACPSGYKLCNGSCIPQNDCCGGCDFGQTCENGECVTLQAKPTCVCNDDSTHSSRCIKQDVCPSEAAVFCGSVCSHHGGMSSYSCLPCQ
jgi:hypothetical protein